MTASEWGGHEEVEVPRENAPSGTQPCPIVMVAPIRFFAAPLDGIAPEEAKSILLKSSPPSVLGMTYAVPTPHPLSKVRSRCKVPLEIEPTQVNCTTQNPTLTYHVYSAEDPRKEHFGFVARTCI